MPLCCWWVAIALSRDVVTTKMPREYRLVIGEPSYVSSIAHGRQNNTHNFVPLLFYTTVTKKTKQNHIEEVKLPPPHLSSILASIFVTVDLCSVFFLFLLLPILLLLFCFWLGINMTDNGLHSFWCYGRWSDDHVDG